VAGITQGAFTGVIGKWKYLPGLDLFAGVIDSYAGDIWIYKPSDWTVAVAPPDPEQPVPAPGTLGLLVLGVCMLIALRRGGLPLRVSPGIPR
jgi:hypothetical protein